jgi:hypothetical protein
MIMNLVSEQKEQSEEEEDEVCTEAVRSKCCRDSSEVC